MTRRQRFTEDEISRAIRGAALQGLTPTRIAIAPDGTITLWFGEDEPDELPLSHYISPRINR